MAILKLFPHDTYNATLLERCASPDWINPEPAPMYAMVAVGGGTAGLIVSVIAASLGAKVALIERGFMGGDCLVTGCVPSKSLLRSARLSYEMLHAPRWGLSSKEVNTDDFSAIMQRLRRIRADISVHDSLQRYTELGVDVFRGDAVFTGPHSVEVGGQVLNFKKATICTGAHVRKLSVPGLEEVGYLTHENIFNLTVLPKKLVVLGGGPIACELAQAFSRLGSKVSMVVRSTFLSREDQEAAAVLADVFEAEDIEVFLHAKLLRAENSASGKVIVIEHEGQEKRIEGDTILVGAGRVPHVEGIGLEKAEVQYTEKGVVVDDFLRTTNVDIFAAGDCCLPFTFTHTADAAAQIVVQNALFKGRKRLSSLVVPWCTYTDPEIAHVGMTERDAIQKGIAVDMYRMEMKDIDRAITDGELYGFIKIMVKKGSDKILGATIVSSHAGEMISEITTAMVGGMGLGTLSDVIHPYPTQAMAVKRVAALYKKSKLTPLVAKILCWWLNRNV